VPFDDDAALEDRSPENRRLAVPPIRPSVRRSRFACWQTARPCLGNKRPGVSFYLAKVDGTWKFCRAHIAQGDERERIWQEITSDGAYVGYAKKAYPRILPLVVHTPVDPNTVKKPDIDRAQD